MRRPFAALLRTQAPMLAVACGIASLLACTGGSSELEVERVHDLVGLFRFADVSEGAPYPLRQVADIEEEHDNRDGVTYLRAPPGTRMTFRDLRTTGPATLRFGCGIAWKVKPPAPGAVTFRVEARDESAADNGSAVGNGSATRDQTAGDGFVTVFEQDVEPTTLAGPGLMEWYEVGLSGTGEANWTVRLSTEAAAGTDAATARAATWPGWFSPTLRSGGRRVPIEQHPVPVMHVAEDLIQSLPDAHIAAQNDADPVTGTFFDAAQGVGIYGGRRALISATAPSRIHYDLDIPTGAVLDFAVGMDTERGWQRPGDGMTFAVEVDGERIWSMTLEAHRLKIHRGWKPCVVDLSRWGGQRVTLHLVTETGLDAENDVGGWANIRVLQRTSAPRLAQSDAPSVFLIVIDTLRSDRLGSYGCEEGLTPRLDAMAAKGVRFSASRSVSPWTWPSTGSLLTGLYPHGHGVVGESRIFLVDQLDTAGEVFGRAGYTTGAFIANLLISRDNNFHQGFETFVCTPGARARSINERVRNWLDNTEGTARFGYVHYFDPHVPYNPPPGYAEAADDGPFEDVSEADLALQLSSMKASGRLDDKLVREWMDVRRRQYDGEVRYIDDAVGELLDELEARGILDDALVVVTSDHGEEFYEHGLIAHGWQLYDESLRVPLWFTGYGGMRLDPGVVDGLVDSKDVLPTMCQLAGITGPRYPIPGDSLITGEPATMMYAHTVNGLETGIVGQTDKLAIVRGQWKLVHTPANLRNELYDLERDPGETRDLHERHPDVTDQLLRMLSDQVATATRDARDNRTESNDMVQDWLRQLGYLGR